MKPEFCKVILILCVFCISQGLSAQNNETRKFALLVSSDEGGEQRVRLKYSRSDAESLRNILIRLGEVNPPDITMLANPSEEELYRHFDTFRNRMENIRGQYKKTEFLFYYSGHADNEGLLLGDENVSYKYIRTGIKNIPVDVKIVILDSCSSGALTRAKGGKKRAPYMYNPAYDMRGEAYLTSSSFDEISQESDKIQASFFTYYLVSGLYGAADVTRDGQVTLSEAYQFAYSKTLLRTEKSPGGPQHPNFDIQMTGTGDVVMTSLRSAQSLLTFDEDINGQLFIRNSDRQLVTELDKISGQKIDLGLDKGDYNIVLLQKNKMFEARISMNLKEEKIISENNFILVSTDPREIQRLKGTAAENEKKEISGKNSIMIELPDIMQLNQFNFQFLPETEPYREPTQFSFFFLAGYLPDVTALSAAGFVSIIGDTMSGLQISGIGNIVGNNQAGFQTAGIFNINNHNGKGVQAGGIFNFTGGDYNGLQISTVFNVNRFGTSGIQMAGIFNTAGNMNGYQTAGIFNYAQQVEGVQSSGVANVAGPVKGLQIAGVLNYASEMNGVQVGVINIASKGNGLSLGLLNLFLHESHHAELWTDETAFVKAAYRNSTKNFHYIYGVGANYYFDTFSLIIGLGGHIPLSEDFSLGLDFLENLVYYPSENNYPGGSVKVGSLGTNQWIALHQIRVSANIQVLKRLAFFAGFEFSFTGANNNNTDLLFIKAYQEGSIRYWPGFFIGVRF